MLHQNKIRTQYRESQQKSQFLFIKANVYIFSKQNISPRNSLPEHKNLQQTADFGVFQQTLTLCHKNDAKKFGPNVSAAGLWIWARSFKESVGGCCLLWAWSSPSSKSSPPSPPPSPKCSSAVPPTSSSSSTSKISLVRGSPQPKTFQRLPHSWSWTAGKIFPVKIQIFR